MEPLRLPPVPFWRCSFLVLPLTSLFSRVLAVPWRLLARCCFTSSQMAWSFGSMREDRVAQLGFLAGGLAVRAVDLEFHLTSR
jgi:hypothetical protein